jgi:post-segregation antitoxin (ccd killing protein)
VGKVKTSIYVDRDLWERYKSSVLGRGLEISRALEELMEEDLPEYLLEKAVERLGEEAWYEIDFEPVKPREGTVSAYVRAMRDERSNSLPRLQ